MISVLHIKNIGIIEDLYINLGDGFNVLTGETGSGKSLIINSLKLISGGRFSKEMIRSYALMLLVQKEVDRRWQQLLDLEEATNKKTEE